MIIWVQAAVATIFCLFVFFDLCSLTPRVAGSITKRNALGYSFNVMLNTLKRIFIVSYPPLLGLISIMSNFETLVVTVLVSYYASIVPLTAAFFLREHIIAFFCALIVAYDERGNMVRSAYGALRTRNEWREEARAYISTGATSLKSGKVVNVSLMLIAAWVYLFYGSSMFVINLFADRFDQYSEIIYQLIGFCNALGTIVMAFVLDPRLSRIYEKRAELGVAYNSLIGAHFLNLMVLGPLLVGAIAAIIWI